MQAAVYRVLTLVSALVVDVPILRQAQDDEPGPAAPVLDAAVREAVAVAWGAVPGLGRGRAVRRCGAASMGGAGAWELDEPAAGEAVGGGGRGRRVLAAARARWVSPG